MKPKTVINITNVNPPEVWIDVKSWCEANGFKYQTLANKKLLPTLENSPVQIGAFTVWRVAVK